MPSQDFNRELDIYISHRRSESQGFKSFMKKLGIKKLSFSLPRRAKQVENIELGNRERVERETPISEEQQVVVEESIVRKPLITRIIEFFKGYQPVEEEAEIQEIPEEPMEEDVKELTKQALKKLHEWLKKLPPDVKQEFKNSEDFELYKKVLKTYGLVK